MTKNEFEKDAADFIHWLTFLDADQLAERLQYPWAGVRRLADRMHAYLQENERHEQS